jgi:hypothetical protein
VHSGERRLSTNSQIKNNRVSDNPYTENETEFSPECQKALNRLSHNNSG